VTTKRVKNRGPKRKAEAVRARLLRAAFRLDGFLSPKPGHRGEVFFSVNTMPPAAINDALALATAWMDEHTDYRRLLKQARAK
jgi:hypothetical protein